MSQVTTHQKLGKKVNYSHMRVLFLFCNKFQISNVLTIFFNIKFYFTFEYCGNT